MTIQQTILKGIRDLLFFHDYLVLPGFGGFVLKGHPSLFSHGGSQLLPPGKTVTFNAQLKQNDGLLLQWLQAEMAVDAAEALRHLKDFTDYCHSILTAKRRLAMDGIGFFYLDFENNLCFEPTHELNFLTSSFGLGALSVKPLEVEEKEPERQVVFNDRVLSHGTAPTPVKRKKIEYRKLSALVLVASFFAGLLFLLVANSVMSGPLTASLFGGEKKQSYQPVNYQPLDIKTALGAPAPYVADANGVAVIKLDDEKPLAVQAINDSENDLDLGSSGKYELVLGCFDVKQNANKLIRKVSLKRVKAFISGKNAKGMFVVSTGNFKNKEAALKELSRIRGLYPNTWIRLKN